MGIMDQSVEDSIGDGGIADLFMPVLHRELTGDDGGGMTVSLLNNLQEVSSLGVVHGSKTQIVDDQNMGFGEFVYGLAVAAVSLGHRHLV